MNEEIPAPKKGYELTPLAKILVNALTALVVVAILWALLFIIGWVFKITATSYAEAKGQSQIVAAHYRALSEVEYQNTLRQNSK